MNIVEDIDQTLRDHEARLKRLESWMTGKKPTKVAHQAAPTSLTDHIVRLRENGFFSQPKTADETHTELQDKYHCESSRVGVALLRLSQRRQLRKVAKSVNKKAYKAYVW